jgi:hypothetical protein
MGHIRRGHRIRLLTTDDPVSFTDDREASTLAMTAETDMSTQVASLQMIFLIDASGSMWRDDLIRHVNFALRKGIPELRLVARDYPGLDLQVRVARFADGAEWQLDGFHA